MPLPAHFYAHTLPGLPPTAWEPLLGHLNAVADRAEQFAKRFAAGAWGRQLGLWHDLGKFTTRFQNRLLQANGYEMHLEEKPAVFARVDHSTAGAKHAIQQFEAAKQTAFGWLLAYAIAGHHAGLPDARTDQDASLEQRRDKPDINWEGAPADLLAPLALETPRLSIDPIDPERAGFQIALFGRMLFSCLVDADFLATESFMNPGRSSQRQGQTFPLPKLLAVLNRHLDQLSSNAQMNSVHACRQQILAACRTAAAQPPGLFALTVPTGGGKTLASLAFALEHAGRHRDIGFERVIYAIPFTSIIEQTASVFASVFEELGSDVVLEHHSNLDPDDKRMTPRSRLAAENWDAPLVVTTNVQLFESLFAARPGKCRKLHRLVNSILILDEVQTLPIELLKPCLAVLRELAADYQCTIVLCTATQPAFDYRGDFKIGLKNIRPIIPAEQTIELYRDMRRTEAVHLGKLTDAELVEHLRGQAQFLCIVNTRKHAAQLYELLRSVSAPEGLFHLSTWMCGAHRSQVIAVIKQRLKDGLPCRVVSTSLIEAGVDVDFPAVFRALAGIDAIAQAAGRCNREGKVPLRTVYVFDPAEGGTSHLVKSTIDSTRELLRKHADLLSLEAVRHYFELHFWQHEGRCDEKDIMGCFIDPGCQTFCYRTAAQRFQMIQDHERPVIIPWGDVGQGLVRELETAPAENVWKIARKLQRFTVGATSRAFDQMLLADITLVRESEFGDRFPVLNNLALYDEARGLNMHEMALRDPMSPVTSG